MGRRGRRGGSCISEKKGRKENVSSTIFPSLASTRLVPLFSILGRFPNPRSTLHPVKDLRTPSLTLRSSSFASVRSSTLPPPPPRRPPTTNLNPNLTNPSLTSSLTSKPRRVISLVDQRGSVLSSRSVSISFLEPSKRQGLKLTPFVSIQTNKQTYDTTTPSPPTTVQTYIGLLTFSSYVASLLSVSHLGPCST